MSAKDSALLGEFQASFCVQDKRRVVSLLKKQDIILSNNRMNTERWLGNLRKRLDNKEALKETYYAQMVDYRERASGRSPPGRFDNSVLPTALGGVEREAWEDEVEDSV